MMSAEENGENSLPQAGTSEAPEHTYLFPKAKGHARSVSHGGATATMTGGGSAGLPSRPSALRSATKGHQRAFSQGQIGEGASVAGPKPGHSRTGSKTDFILPPGHKEPSSQLAHSASRASARGHSRQASRSESIYTLRRNSEVPQWRRAVRWVLRRQAPLEDRMHLVVVPNHVVPEKTPWKEHPNGHRANNKVRTTKYTFLSFIPKNLLEQFHRIANLYFIFIVLLNWFPAINAFGKEIAMIPVLFVLGVTAVKDLFEDRRRHASDKRINNSTCRVYKKAVDRYTRVKWKELRVGDLVHLSNNEPVPADIVLLRSSDAAGVAYLDTCNLDGESNLKQRQVATGFREKHSIFTAGKFVSIVEVDRPSTKIYRFHGALVHPNGRKVPLSTENLLLRECLVKNTDFIEGIVVYAGHETKAMLNNGGPRYKRSALERQMNTDVIWCVLLLLLMCCIGAVGCKLWLETFVKDDPTIPLPPFIPFSFSPSYEGLLSFWTFVIVLQVMIPLSLYVTIEISKILQVYHIHNNVDLYDPLTDKRIQCRALNITEELGQVQYVFTDKTGTLTENKMVFRRCAIADVDYEHSTAPPADFIDETIPQSTVAPNPQMLEEASAPIALEGTRPQLVKDFLLALAVCNTVVVSYQPHHDSMDSSGMLEPVSASNGVMSNGIKPGIRASSAEKYARLAESRSTTPSPPPAIEMYRLPDSPLPVERFKFNVMKSLPFLGRDRVGQAPVEAVNGSAGGTINGHPVPPRFEAESPDELALVDAALAYRVVLRRRNPTEIELTYRDEPMKLSVLRVLAFDSSRKRMSIAVRGAGEIEPGGVTLFVKGADTAVLDFLAIGGGSAQATRIQRVLDAYARRGLRTLVVARRSLTARQWIEWNEEHARAELIPSHSERERRIRDSISRLESELTLMGATGIEDRLQEGVPQTVAALLEAGMVVWVLTGDKPETAVNVAYSARLFSPRDELLYLMARNKDQAESTIKCYLDSLDSPESSHSSSAGSHIGPRATRRSAINRSRSLVVDGKTLTYILDRRTGLIGPFLSLTKRCSSVLCCRATPLQKAYIVRIVKEEMHVNTLAIGDGANDVSMIQTADVGIGISGQEGMQAVMASDFALSRFKFLERFLLVHGHWCYDRLARMILYFFFKNATFVFLIFWYQLFCGFSASIMIDQMHLMLYNLMFTALPPLAIGAYDRMAPENLLLERPALYRAGRLGRAYRPHSYWLAIIEALYISVVIFFTTLHAYWGTDVDIWEFGMVTMSSCLVVMLVHVAVETRSWTIIHIMSLVGSLGAFYVFTLLYNTVCVSCFHLPSTYWVIHRTIIDPMSWLVMVVTLVASLAPRVAWRAVANTAWPGALGRAALQRRRRPRAAPPLAAHYHNPSSTTHIYRATNDDIGKVNSMTTVVG